MFQPSCVVKYLLSWNPDIILQCYRRPYIIYLGFSKFPTMIVLPTFF